VKTLTLRDDSLARHVRPVAEQIRTTLNEIHAFCSDACDARQAAREGSAEWHKRTGEVLAYARMTAMLSMLEEGIGRVSVSGHSAQNRLPSATNSVVTVCDAD